MNDYLHWNVDGFADRRMLRARASRAKRENRSSAKRRAECSHDASEYTYRGPECEHRGPECNDRATQYAHRSAEHTYGGPRTHPQ